MNNTKYIKDIFKLIQKDGSDICKGKKFKIHNITLKDKIKTKRNIEILLYDGIEFYNDLKDVKLEKCKMIIKLDGKIKYESAKGVFKFVNKSYVRKGKFNLIEFLKLNTPDFKTENIKSIEFRNKIHENQYYSFRSLIGCQVRLDNALRSFIDLNSYKIQ